MKTDRKCRIRGCQNKLAAQNKSGFCVKCQQEKTGLVAKTDPRWAAARRAYFAEWRRKNQKKYGKTRPTPEDKGLKPKKPIKLPTTKAGLEALIRKAVRAA